MCLWVIGEYVLDVALELDLADVYADDPTLEPLIRVEGDELLVSPDLRLTVDVHGHGLSFQLATNAVRRGGHQVLHPGAKYQLLHLPRLVTPSRPGDPFAPPKQPELRTIPRRLSWGGGGLNLVMAVRDISPPDRTPRLKFTAMSHGWRLNSVLEGLRALLQEVAPQALDLPIRTALDAAAGVALTPPEKLVTIITERLRSFGPDLNVVEWALARRAIEFAFLRDGILQPLEGSADRLLLPRANLVISRVSSDRVDLKDKIILKSPPLHLTDALSPTQAGAAAGTPDEKTRRTQWRTRTQSFIKEAFEDRSFVMINSVRDPDMVDLLLEAYRKKQEAGLASRGIIAMTETNLTHIPALFQRVGSLERRVSEFSMIFNDRELALTALRLYRYAGPRPDEGPLRQHLTAVIERYGRDVARKNGYETASAFLAKEGEMAERALADALSPIAGLRPRLAQAIEILDVFRKGTNVLRHLYLTLGSHGSLCLDAQDTVWYAQVFQGPDQEFDTTGLGDAWAATIALLEYHATRVYEHPDDYQHPEALKSLRAKDYLKAASAVAYCKFTNPYGRVFLPRLLHVLRTQYLPVTEVMRLSPTRTQPVVLSRIETEQAQARQCPETAERAMCEALLDVLGMSGF